MAYTDEQRRAARAELARRELARRQQSSESKPEEDSGEYLDSLPEEGFISKLPRNIAIGGANLAQSTANIPSDIARSIEQYGPEFDAINNKNFPIPGGNNRPSSDIVEQFNKMHNVPESMKNPLYNKPLSERIPHLQEHDFAKMFGQQGEPSLMDALIQKGIEYAPAIAAGGAGLARLPITKYPGTKALKQVKKLIEERGVGNLKIPEHIFEDIKENKFLRNTQPNRNLIEAAKRGHYNDLFGLQSDLGKVERGYTRDPFSAANRQFGRDVGANRQELLSSMKEQLANLGHEDLAELLAHGQNKYRQYMKFRPYRNAAVGLALGSIPGFSLIKKLIP